MWVICLPHKQLSDGLLHNSNFILFLTLSAPEQSAALARVKAAIYEESVTNSREEFRDHLGPFNSRKELSGGCLAFKDPIEPPV